MPNGPGPGTVAARAGLGAPRWPAGIGPGGGGGGGWRLNLAPTPELMARVAALPPVRDVAQVDLDRESRHDRRFNLSRLLGEFRQPAACSGWCLWSSTLLAAWPARSWSRQVSTAAWPRVRWPRCSRLRRLPSRHPGGPVDEIGETFVTGRAAQRIMLSLRIRIWAQLQRLSLDYYEREMAGRIMTRMTTDVDQFESLIENGAACRRSSRWSPSSGSVSRSWCINPELGLCTLSVVIPLAVATVVFRRRAARALRPVPGADRDRQRRLPGEPVRACASPRPSCTRARR